MLRQKGRKAVTLVEIVLSFLLLCSCVFGIAGMISFGHKGTSVDFRQGEAVQILTDRMNKLSVMSFDNLQSMMGKKNSVVLKREARFIKFGDEEAPVIIGKNKYVVTAELAYQPITFTNLKGLRFPNKQYDPFQPHTWVLDKRQPSDIETFGDGRQAVIKITVKVRPINNYMLADGDGGYRREREISAVTFVANLDGYI